MKKHVILLFVLIFGLKQNAQTNYDIKITMKNCQDTTMYLVRTLYDRQYVSDTCLNVKNGNIRFKGNKKLNPGVYTLVSQEKTTYFDFLINENYKFGISFDRLDIANSLKATGSKENENMFAYLKFMTNKNIEFSKFSANIKNKSKEDSIKLINEKLTTMNKEVVDFEASFMEKVKGTFVYDFFNVKAEKQAKTTPKASNGRPDSLYNYLYYKNHFFDGVDFKDERILTVPFFDDRVKRYFESVIFQYSPDSLIKEIDYVLGKCEDQSLAYNILLGYFTYKYEQDNRMGFDKAFVHIAEKYIMSGRAKDVYSEETIQKISERVKILKNLLIGTPANELYLIDTIDGKQISKLGFDTVSNSTNATALYYKHEKLLVEKFKTLYMVNAKYTILVFWDVDCGHCQTEVPKLNEALNRIDGKIDYKVVSVYTKDDFNSWRKFVIDKKLDFIHLYDPVHINNMKEKYDIVATPVIYVLDKDKIIRGKKLTADQVPDLIEYLDKQ